MPITAVLSRSVPGSKRFARLDQIAPVPPRSGYRTRVALDCLKWNKRAINQTFETMGLRAAIQYGSEACAIMDATGSPEAAEFDRIRRADGLGAALKWRDGQFAQFE